MKNKGFTLMEVIVSIMVLSIASITLATSFGYIMQFVNKGNLIASASDDLLSVAEGNKGNALLESVTNTPIDTTYHINESIDVKGNAVTMKSSKSDDITLTRFEKTDVTKLSAHENYKTIIDLANDLYSYTQTAINDKCDTTLCDLVGYNFLVRYILENYQDDKFPEFPDVMLPKELADTKLKYYLRVYYPWQTTDGTTITYDQPLLYLNTENSASLKINGDVNVQLFFDIEENIWYFHSTKGNQYSFTNDELPSESDPSFQLNNEKGKIKNGSEFITHVKDPKNGWYYLDKDAHYDGTNIDACWKAVK